MLTEYTEKIDDFLKIHPIYKNKDTVTIDNVREFATGESAAKFSELMLHGAQFLELQKKMRFASPLDTVAMYAPTRGPLYQLLAKEIMNTAYPQKKEKDATEENAPILDRSVRVAMTRDLPILYEIGKDVLEGIGSKAALVDKAIKKDDLKSNKKITNSDSPSLWQRIKNFITNLFTWNKKDSIQSTTSSVSSMSDVSDTVSETSTRESTRTTPSNSVSSISASSLPNEDRSIENKQPEPIRWELNKKKAYVPNEGIAKPGPSASNKELNPSSRRNSRPKGGGRTSV